MDVRKHGLHSGIADGGTVEAYPPETFHHTPGTDAGQQECNEELWSSLDDDF
ncbi:MAG TPA: hypothetical protein VN828_16390 [Acidobacteriaceae bacterium]|nr:hypothetical protein [Acidobacteriaceae bacterium]